MIEELKRELEEEKIRHEKIVKELEEKIKKLEEKKEEEKEEEKELEEKIEKIPAVKVDRQDVYFIPPKKDEEEKIEKIKTDNPKNQNVYFPPENKIERAKKPLGLFGLIKQFFKAKKIESKPEINDIIYTVPEETKLEKIKYSPSDSGPIYMVPKSNEKQQEIEKTDEYTNIIEYAKNIKKDKENHKMLQNKYSEALKSNNKEQVLKIKNMLWESQNKITLAESFLRNKLKEIRRSTLNIEEKTKLINYICGIAKIKAKEKPEHLKEETKIEERGPVDELNERKEKILSSKHFTDVQKKNMIREIDDELIELAKKEEKDIKTLWQVKKPVFFSTNIAYKLIVWYNLNIEK